jgi:hypothetical protein
LIELQIFDEIAISKPYDKAIYFMMQIFSLGEANKQNIRNYTLSDKRMKIHGLLYPALQAGKAIFHMLRKINKNIRRSESGGQLFLLFQMSIVIQIIIGNKLRMKYFNQVFKNYIRFHDARFPKIVSTVVCSQIAIVYLFSFESRNFGHS